MSGSVRCWRILWLIPFQPVSYRQRNCAKLCPFTACSILICILVAAFWHPPAAPFAEEIPALPYILPRASCPPQVDKLTIPPAAVTNNETFFVVEPLSSFLSPMTSTNPSLSYSGPNTVLVNDEMCFSYLGHRGGVTIVSKFIQYRITHLTVDNSATNGTIHYRYHPKEGTLWGLIEGELPRNLTTRSMHTISDRATYVAIGRFCFDPVLSASQTYSVKDLVVVNDQPKFSVFYLEIESNWGGSHTCLCHVELHGEG